MKRNIISSKVEPQNTEDLWLNLVDGNIYSYEYGTWTNVNNVPNRVFNLDIDYTEENLTKFLSPLYEEGFSDDDFPKKVWDKFCETNPEFKLQGERENIRINVSLRDSKTFLKPVINDYIVGYIDTSEVIDWPSMSGNQTFASILELDLTIGDMGQIYNIDPNGAFIGSYLGRHDEIIGEAYDAYKLDLTKLCSALGRDFDPNKKYTVIHTAGRGNTNSSGDVNSFGLPVYDMVVGKDNIASADIKLKQLSNESSFNYNKDFITHNSNYGAEYISGIVSNKLDKNKMWEYLGKDIKYLVPAKIDILLPYDISSDEFPFLPSNVGFSLSEMSDVFMAAVAFRYTEPENIDDELMNSYRHYLNLESPFSFGVYQISEDLKVNKLLEEGFAYIHVMEPGEDDLSFYTFTEYFNHTPHTKTQAYYDLIRKFGYEIIEPQP